MRRTLPPRAARRSIAVVLTSLAAMAASPLAYADGIDVSHWQGSVNWPKVKAAGMQFAFMKATESTTYTDTAFATNWAGAAAPSGIYRGAYHFARPSTASGSAAKQAALLRLQGRLVPGPRHAAPGPRPRGHRRARRRPRCAPGSQTWLTRRRAAHRPDADPLLLAVFWETTSATAPLSPATRCGSRTTRSSSPRVPGGWPTWTFWQRTSSGSVSGISGNVDMNRFNGTTAQLAALANTTGGSSAPVPSGPDRARRRRHGLTGAHAPPRSATPCRSPVTLSGVTSAGPGGARCQPARVAVVARTVGAADLERRWPPSPRTQTGHYALATVVHHATPTTRLRYGRRDGRLRRPARAPTSPARPAAADLGDDLPAQEQDRPGRKGTA